jgi:hypothetical protein
LIERSSRAKGRGICLHNKDLSEDPALSSEDNDVHVIAAGTNGESLQVIVENNVSLPELSH